MPTPSLTLYVKTDCPYCAKVLKAGEELDIPFDQKNIADPDVATDLIARGGKRQVPYLIDNETNTEMYESDAIVEYLHQRFGHKE
jgi:glutathione S-transferase